MAANKTRPTRTSVTAFLNGVEHPRRRADARKAGTMMRRAGGKRATMCGPRIVGYGGYHY